MIEKGSVHRFEYTSQWLSFGFRRNRPEKIPIPPRGHKQRQQLCATVHRSRSRPAWSPTRSGTRLPQSGQSRAPEMSANGRTDARAISYIGLSKGRPGTFKVDRPDPPMCRFDRYPYLIALCHEAASRPLEKGTFLLCTKRTFSLCGYTFWLPL
jgi:hypothetical protein